MKLAVLRERRAHETRVAATVDSVKRLIALGFDVCIESGAGHFASVTDTAYAAAGATIAADAAAALAGSDVVLKVQRPLIGAEGEIDELGLMKPGTLLIGMFAPYGERAAIDAFARQGVSACSMELVPRISRAQSMDVLSSQANLAGYKSVLDAAAEFGRAMPMMMTAAGTIAPAKVFVLGAGVAGLQAIATARRLGAVVSATDVRPAAKEQVESLGATFVWLESDEAKQAETKGGYAKEMSADYQRRQAELVADTLKKQDIVICTAAIPGKQAPRLVSAEMVRSMRPGSVIVDLAVESGGNCALSQPGHVVDVDGVRVVGHRNVPGRLPVDASALYARNLVAFLALFVDSTTKTLRLDVEDEIVKATMLTRGGAVIHPAFAAASSPTGKA
ncbi:MAG: Re/Si-specific NAD(P)(+) transhydrogenase subunit alpha [Planctomycetes bacterium]|nr:Re/Si-specific NAD(P)(+) transhydrogenase subunit alpha [Planctomycetota bacterium]